MGCGPSQEVKKLGDSSPIKKAPEKILKSKTSKYVCKDFSLQQTENTAAKNNMYNITIVF